MNQSTLPEFRRMPRSRVMTYVNSIFNTGGSPNFVELIEFDDGHYRVVFRDAYFRTESGVAEPTKSQWNTLKKKMKRHNKTVFVFKETGQADCSAADPRISGRCYTLDFGFFVY